MKVKIDKIKTVDLSILMIMLVITFALAAWGQEADAVSVDTSVIIPDTISTFTSIDTLADTSAIVDTVTVTEPDDLADFLEEDDYQDFVEAEADSLSASAPLQKLDLVRREHNHKRQVKLAAIMMTFIVLMFATSQSWNPR